MQLVRDAEGITNENVNGRMTGKDTSCDVFEAGERPADNVLPALLVPYNDSAIRERWSNDSIES